MNKDHGKPQRRAAPFKDTQSFYRWKNEQFPLDSTPIAQSILGLVELKNPFVNVYRHLFKNKYKSISMIFFA